MALLRIGGLNSGKRREELLSSYEGEEPYMPGGYETPYNGEEPWLPDGYDDEPYDDEEPYEGEFREFIAQQNAGDLEECYRQLDESLLVSRIQNTVRREAGVIFPADEQ